MFNSIMCTFYKTLCNFQWREGRNRSHPVEASWSFSPQSQEHGGAPCGRVLRHRENPPQHVQIHSFSTGRDTYCIFFLISFSFTFWSLEDANKRLLFIGTTRRLLQCISFSKVTAAVALITFASWYVGFYISVIRQ